MAQIDAPICSCVGTPFDTRLTPRPAQEDRSSHENLSLKPPAIIAISGDLVHGKFESVAGRVTVDRGQGARPANGRAFLDQHTRWIRPGRNRRAFDDEFVGTL